MVFNHEVRKALADVVGEEELAELPFPERHETLTKRLSSDFIEDLVNLYGPTAVSMVLDAFKSLGFRYASASGLTISKNDIVIPPDKDEIIAKYDDKVDEVEGFFGLGEMSPEERHEEVIKLWEQATDEVAEAMERHLFRLNPIFMMANSGARGSFKQIRQLAGMRGCMNNPKGETIERPDQEQLHGGPVGAGVLHLHARRPQGPGRHRPEDRRLGLPHPAPGGRVAGRHRPRARLRHHDGHRGPGLPRRQPLNPSLPGRVLAGPGRGPADGRGRARPAARGGRRTTRRRFSPPGAAT